MWVCKYFDYFIVFSCMGWVYESLYCTIKGKKWENRGFLYGPLCPIYGAGALGLTLIMDALIYAKVPYTWWQVFIVGFFGSIVLEFGTSWILEKLFHAYWWDYSDMPLNIQGRVCFPYSIAFGFAALIVVYGIAPYTEKVMGFIPPIGLEILGLIFMAVLAWDTALTVSALTSFSRNVVAMQDAVNVHMEHFVEDVGEKAQAAGEALAEERERFSKENMEQTIVSLGAIYREGVKRVKGFKFPQIEKKIAFNKAFDAIKRHVPRRKNKKAKS